jgi:nucleotide-binding universal stress UspA family protein
MDSFKHVLAPIDFSSASTAALTFGAGIAGAMDARLTLLHVYPYSVPDSEVRPYLPQVPPVDQATKAAVLDDLSHMSVAARAVVRQVQVAMLQGDPSEEILAYAESHGVDLIVMGTHGRRGLDRIIGGSVTERVARDAGVSVVVVHDPRPDAFVSPPRLSKIVCAVDLGESSDDTLETAAMLARVAGTRLTVLHAIESGRWEASWSVARGEEDAHVRGLSERGYRRLGELLARHRHSGVALEPAVVVGHPRQAILEAVARERADLLVIGAHRMSRMNRVLFGSTAEHVLRAARGPVLIARAGRLSSTVAVEIRDAVLAPAR